MCTAVQDVHVHLANAPLPLLLRAIFFLDIDTFAIGMNLTASRPVST